MSAVQKRNRQEVHEADRHGEPAATLNKSHRADLGHLAGHLRRADQPRHLVGRLAPGEHADDIGRRRLDDEDDPVAPQTAHSATPQRSILTSSGLPDEPRPRWPILRFPSTPWSTTLIVRRGRQLHIGAAPIDDEGHRQAGAHDGGLLERLEAADRAAVHGLYEVAGGEAGVGRRASGLDAPDPGHVLDPAEDHEHAGENHKRQQEIRDRAGEHDGGPVRHRLGVQRRAN